MKKLIANLILINLFVTHVTAQWTNLNSGTNEFLPSISFPSENTGYCISESGVLHKTTNGGANWNTIGTINGFRVIFQDDLTGLVYGYNEILKTTDGGTNWNPVLTQDLSRYISVLHMIDQNIGYAGSMNFIDSISIYYTSNGGNTWSLVAHDVNNMYDQASMYFYDVNVGFMGNLNGQLYKTSDAGVTWSEVHSTSGPVNDFYFASSNVGYAVSDMEFLKTTNGGDNWIASTPPFSSIYAAITITPNGTIHVTGGNGFNAGTLIKSTDNGTTWTQTGVSSQSFYDVCFVNDSIGYTCGTNGQIMKFGSVTLSISEKTDLEFTIYPNPTTGIFTINYPSSNKDQNIYIHVYNNIGQKLISETFLPHSLDLSLYPNGIYFLVVKTNEGVFREKIVKN